MKKRLLITTLVLAMLMIMANVSSVFADSDAREPYAYDYTVKVYSGEQGEFSGGRTVIEKSVQPGETVDISQMASDAGFKVTNDEYYCRGFRESGHDNDESPSLQAFTVTEDVSYEAAYGIRGNMVKYTIMYLDEDGASLRSADEYYGMIGDKPVVSYKYIEGYQPNAYNLTKTLTANESENVFGFSYTENGEAEEEEDNDNNNNANNNGGANNANANNANANNANANNPAANANANADGNNAPANVVDLDDGATPLAEGADGAEGDGASDLADSETPKAGISKAAIGGIAALVVAAAGIVAFLAKRRRDAEDEDEDEDEDE